MATRREPRKEIRVAIRIFGTDIGGKPFTENVFTVNVSRSGAMVIEIQARLKVGEIIGLAYGKVKGRYQVRWIRNAGTRDRSLAGLQSVNQKEVVWDFPLPATETEDTVRPRAINERRKSPRRKCNLSVELHPAGDDNRIWGRAADISLGGCFVEMPSPVREGTRVRLALWIQDKKLWALGKVAVSRLGSGVGIEFLEMKDEDREQLRRYFETLPGPRP